MDALVEGGFVCHRQLLTCLNLRLDLALELSKVKHHLVDLERPHGQLLCLLVETILRRFLLDSLLALLMGDLLPLLVDFSHTVPMHEVASVSSQLVLLSLAFLEVLQGTHGFLVHVGSIHHINEAIHHALVLLSDLLELNRLLLLVLDGLLELLDVVLHDVQVDLVVLLVLRDVILLHLLVLEHQFLLELSEDPVICTFKGFNMLVVVGELHFLSNYREIGAGLNTTLTRALLILIYLLHVLAVASSCLLRLVAGALLDASNDVRLDVLAHVVVAVVANGSVADCSRWTSAPRLIIFNFLDHFVVVVVAHAPTAFVTHFDLGGETGTVDFAALVATDWRHVVRTIEV